MSMLISSTMDSKLDPPVAGTKLGLFPDCLLATSPISSTSTLLSSRPSSRTFPRRDLQVAVRLLSVVKSLETRAHQKGLNANANVNANHQDYCDEEHIGSGVDDTKFLCTFARQAERKVKRCLSWRPLDASVVQYQDHGRQNSLHNRPRYAAAHNHCEKRHGRHSRAWNRHSNAISRRLDTTGCHFRRYVYLAYTPR